MSSDEAPANHKRLPGESRQVYRKRINAEFKLYMNQSKAYDKRSMLHDRHQANLAEFERNRKRKKGVINIDKCETDREQVRLDSEVLPTEEQTDAT